MDFFLKNINTKKTIVPIKDKKTGETYISLSEFSDVIDISLVDSYSLEKSFIDRILDEKSLILKFYDKKGKVIVPNKKD